tara:strand:+ start:96 stop:1205 length:1110 start_codon:yes stop_codon:yes gene_type:complete
MVIFSIILFSCGSYQYSGNISDGIYGENNNLAYQQKTSQDDIYDEKVKNTYYQTVFNEKVMEYEKAEVLNDSIFTDIENYQSVVENDSVNNNYAPWGEDINHLTINIYRGPTYGSIRWSRLWNYPIWLNNYGYGYGSVWNTWGYGYNNYWLRPHIYPFGGYYNDFYSPFHGWGWGYGYGYGYGYYNPWGFGYRPYHYYNGYWGRDNSSIAYISGGRGSRNGTSSRTGYTNNSSRSDYVNTTSRIGNRMNNLSSSTLRDRISRVDRINNAARVKPTYYSKPVSTYASGYKPSSSSTKPSSNYNYKPSGYNNKPSNYNSGSSGSYKPSSSYGSGSSGNLSSPSFKPSSSSRPSSSSSGSRGGGRSGGRSGY